MECAYYFDFCRLCLHKTAEGLNRDNVFSLVQNNFRKGNLIC